MECFKSVLNGIGFVTVCMVVLAVGGFAWALTCAFTAWVTGVEPNSATGFFIQLAWGIVFLGTVIGAVECHS